MTEFQPGDIIEISTEKGLAYVQVTHRHQAYPEVIRVLNGVYPKRPDNLEKLAGEDTALTAMIPLYGAMKRGDIKGEHIGRARVPKAAETFPTFRMPIRDKKGGIAYWWFWDGDGLSYDANPDPSFEKMPMRDVTTADRLMEKLKAL